MTHVRRPAAWRLSATALPLALLALAAAISPGVSDATAGPPVRTGAAAAGSTASSSLRTPLSAVAGDLQALGATTPEVSLVTEPGGFELRSTEDEVKFRAVPQDVPSDAEYTFEYQEVQSESESEWMKINATPLTELQAAESRLSLPVSDERLPGDLSDGLYNFRVQVAVGGKPLMPSLESELANVLVIPSDAPPPILIEALTPAFRSGSIILHAYVTQPTARSGKPLIQKLEFKWKPSHGTHWEALGAPIEVNQKPASQTRYASVPFSNADGLYDFQAVAVYQEGTEPQPSVSRPLRNVVLDNTPPTVKLLAPASPIEGATTLEAEVGDPETSGGPPSSGVSTVRFQAHSQSAGGTWITLGTQTKVKNGQGEYPKPVEDYSQPLNIGALGPGTWEFRAIAEDRAGNVQYSENVTNIQVGGSSTPAVSASLASEAAPASEIRLLGTIAATGETWAYGFTSAPAAEVGTYLLQYEAPGKQLVLLRHTKSEGWQIREVLECQAHTAGCNSRTGGNSTGLVPFELLPPEQVRGFSLGATGNEVEVAGAMTPSGEAWLSLYEPHEPGGNPTFGVFHREAGPGKPFVLDPQSTEALKSLFPQESGGSTEISIKLGETHGGTTYGMLVSGAGQSYGLLHHAGGESEWQLHAVEQDPKLPGTKLKLAKTAPSGPEEGWGAFDGQPEGHGLVLARLKGGTWRFFPDTGNSALDLSNEDSNAEGNVAPIGLKADQAEGAEAPSNAVWVEANVQTAEQGQKVDPSVPTVPVVALLKEDGEELEPNPESWCSLNGSLAMKTESCKEPLGDATVPDAIFGGEAEPVALGLQERQGTGPAVDVFEHGAWRGVLAPGYNHPPTWIKADPDEQDSFSSENEGWLVSSGSGLGEWTQTATVSPLAAWPIPDRATLTSVALPPGSNGTAAEPGALAVGLRGTALSYEAASGWQVTPVPSRAAHADLSSVAFAGPASAFAVGQFGTILHWNGSSWSQEPSTTTLTLNSVAFSASGEGFAVGIDGTILHYNGQAWTPEPLPPSIASGKPNVTSVAVVGSEAFAIAGGNLLTHTAGGTWKTALCGLPSASAKCEQEDEEQQWKGPEQQGKGPDHATPESLRLAAALPDGGVILAGRSTMLFRQHEGDAFTYAPQTPEGVAVALAPFREDGELRTYVAIAPEGDVGRGYPSGDGELLLETESGWRDLSRAQYVGSAITGDGATKADPVLAIATGAGGEHAWAVGGYDGTEDAAGQGTEEDVTSRPEAWQSASMWRYDAGGSEQSPATGTEAPALPGVAGDISFAFFTSPLCRLQCSAVAGAQPDVNLSAAAREIAAFAGQEGGPAFAMLGGNAVGPIEQTAFEEGEHAIKDLANLHEQLAPLAGLPTFAAPGIFDRVPTEPPGAELRPWAEAFAAAPQPFGQGQDSSAITPAGPSSPPLHSAPEVHDYYAFNASQNNATLRVIVLDDSNADAFESQQREWLEEQLNVAEGEGLRVVIVAASPLRASSSAGNFEPIAQLLANPGCNPTNPGNPGNPSGCHGEKWNNEVVAIFSTDGSRPKPSNPSELHEYDQKQLVPERNRGGPNENPPPGPLIPEYEGATLGYQQIANDGVTWYLVTINTQEATASVSAIPVLESLALKAVDGLAVPRGRTLEFEGVARRPDSTLATKATEAPKFEGYDEYAQIPAPSCSSSVPGGGCVKPSYKFTSSVPAIGAFVEAQSGSASPVINPETGKAVLSSKSGLFCGFNTGTTVVTLTAGLVSYSETVTVQAATGANNCGKLPKRPPAGKSRTTVKRSQAGNGAAAPPAAPPAALSGVNPSLTAIPPAPAAAPAPLVKPIQPQVIEPIQAPVEAVPLSPAIVPATTPPVEPIPPGSGGYAQSPSAAERKEKARKHASQSAFVIRPAGTSGEEWFYGAVAISTLLVLLLTAGSLRGGPRDRPALIYDRTPVDRRARRRR